MKRLLLAAIVRGARRRDPRLGLCRSRANPREPMTCASLARAARLRTLFATAALLVALMALSAPAYADEETATSGDVTATFSYDQPQDYQWENLHLTISRAGQPVYDEPISAPHCEEPYCAPGGAGRSKSLHAHDLDGDGRPEVILDLWWGGAHCCSLAQVFNDGGGTYRRRATLNFGDFGFRLKDLDADGLPEFVGADYRFDYEFTAFAFSGSPIRVYNWHNGSFRQVTSHFQPAIHADAAAWMHRYRKAPRSHEPEGMLAAWAADEYRLGDRAKALRFIRKEIRSGKLSTMPNRQTFVHHLDRVLTRWGY